MQEERWREFDLAVCRWIVKELPPDELPDAAAAALMAECKTQALIRLAGMDQATWSEFPPVVAKIFEERGCAVPTFGQAITTLADDLLHQIVGAAWRPERERTICTALRATSGNTPPTKTSPSSSDSTTLSTWPTEASTTPLNKLKRPS
jgi:hypothetical protein